MAILSKACKPDNFELHNSLKLSFTNIRVFVRILLTVNLSLNQTLLTFLLCVRQTWMTQLISGNFSVIGYLPLIRKDSSTHIRKFCRFLLMFSTGFTSLSALLFFPLSITFFIFVQGF